MAKTAVATDRALFNRERRQRVILSVNKDSDASKKQTRRKTVPIPAIRPSLSVGTVCILVAGPYKGKRVIVVKHLDSGNIVVTGPYSINGVPFRRVNQRFVIATSTKLPVEGLNTELLNNEFFNKIREKKTKKDGEDVFMAQGTSTAPRVLPEHKVELQKKFDQPLVKFLEKSENALLKQYLKTRFTLRDKMYPHALKF